MAENQNRIMPEENALKIKYLRDASTANRDDPGFKSYLFPASVSFVVFFAVFATVG